MTGFALIPKADLEVIRKLAANMQAQDMLNIDQAAEFIGIEKRTLQNWLCKGKVPDNIISVGVGGVKFFSRAGLAGLVSKD